MPPGQIGLETATAPGEQVITKVPDYVIEAAEGFGNALRGIAGGKVDGGLQDQADIEDADYHHVQQFLSPGRGIWNLGSVLARLSSGGHGCVQVGVDRDQAVEAIDAQYAADGISGDHQPQLGLVRYGTVMSTCQRVRSGVIARDCPGQIRDQYGRAAVNDPEQLLADLVGVGAVDVLR